MLPNISIKFTKQRETRFNRTVVSRKASRTAMTTLQSPWTSNPEPRGGRSTSPLGSLLVSAPLHPQEAERSLGSGTDKDESIQFQGSHFWKNMEFYFYKSKKKGTCVHRTYAIHFLLSLWVYIHDYKENIWKINVW